ncbi:hypothetical protein Mapa_008039 [Marchantia paleacea]|nr:hypothetical protein Mapa_008039 [Marchantia paleacea]
MWIFTLIYPATKFILILCLFQSVLITSTSARVVYGRNPLTSSSLESAGVTNFSRSGERSLFGSKRKALHAALSHIFHARSPYLPENCVGNCITEHWLTQLESFPASRTGWFNLSFKSDTAVSNPVGLFWLSGKKMLQHFVTLTITGTDDEGAQDVDFVIDTGGDFTWLQCEPCTRCFSQKRQVFDPSSPHHLSFTKLKAGDLYCNILQRSSQGGGADGELCKYKIVYADTSWTRGYAGADHMRWLSLDESKYIYLENFSFGCGNDNDLQHVFGAGGVLSLGNAGDGISFLDQFKDVTGASFSYCLPIVGSDEGAGFLDIGDAAMPDPDGYNSTTFVGGRDDQGIAGLYYLDVVDFHMDGTSVGIPEGTFDFKPGKYGGFMVDSGTMIMDLVEEGYVPLRNAYRNAMIPQLGTNVVSGVMGLDTCWDITGKDVDLITAAKYGPTFRDGTRMTIGRIASFLTYVDISGNALWCLPVGIPESGQISIMGSYAQMQMHAVFNKVENVFQWRNDVDIC